MVWSGTRFRNEDVVRAVWAWMGCLGLIWNGKRLRNEDVVRLTRAAGKETITKVLYGMSRWNGKRFRNEDVVRLARSTDKETTTM